MSSTLVVRKTPKRTRDEITFKLPLKAIVARKFFDHDGSCGGPLLTVSPAHLDWFEGVLASGLAGASESDRRNWERVVEILRAGESIDLSWDV